MAEWKPQINPYYNTSYYSYTWGFMNQHEPEENNENLSGWNEPNDLNHYNSGMTPAYSAAPAPIGTRDASPPGSPEQHAVNGYCQTRGSGVSYLGDDQEDGLLHAAPQQATSDSESEVKGAESESAGDSDTRGSPDSGSCGNSGETSLPQADPATWVQEDLDKEASSSPNGSSSHVSSSINEPLTALEKTSTTTVSTSKRKVRVSFSARQMNALFQRFSVQRYLSPAEMKNLSEMIGLTYKQVKTWFQNRRMKLRRHQKEMRACQGEAQPQLKENYNRKVVEGPFWDTALQNMTFYLAAKGSAPRSAGYPSWSSNTPQAAMPTRPQMAALSMPPGVVRYNFNPTAFNSVTANNAVHDTSLKSRNVEPVNKGIVHNAGK